MRLNLDSAAGVKKASAFLMAVSLIFLAVYSPFGLTPKAHAQLPIGAQLTVEAPVSPQLIAILSMAAAAGPPIIPGGQSAKTGILDGLAWMVAKAAVQAVTHSVVNWINSGFQGSPAFVTNLESELLKVADTKVNLFFQNLSASGAIQSPFQALIAQSVLQEYLKETGQSSFAIQHPYTLSTVSSNPSAFIKGDFTQGGWNAWFTTTVHPENNPYGALMITQQALNAQIAAGQQTRLTELNWSKGFLSWRGSCKIDGGGGIVNPKDLTTGGVPTITQNPDGTLNITGGSSGSSGGSSGGSASLTKTDTCLQYNIETPGSVIESQLEKQLGTGIEGLQLADSINEIVGALAAQLVNQVLGGVGLSGTSQPAAGGGPSYIDQASNPAQFTAPSSGSTILQSLASAVSAQLAQVQSFQSEWNKIKTAADSAKAACTTAGHQTTIDQIVQPILTNAAAMLTKAAGSLAQLQKIQGEVAVAQANDDASAQTPVISAEYTALTASSTYPTSQEFNTADSESRDTGTSTPTSLYTQMTNLAKNGCVTGP